MRSSGLALPLLAVVLVPHAARAEDTWSDPLPGVRYLYRSTVDQEIHVAVVDLCAPGIDVRTTAAGESGRTVSSFADLVGADLAVNGDFFDGAHAPLGLAAHDGTVWAGEDTPGNGPVAFGLGRVELRPQEDQSGLEPWMLEVVSGNATLLVDGIPRDHSINGGCGDRHPRTFVGQSADRRQLIVAAVDGRLPPGRIGMTCTDMTGLLVELGAAHGVNLDGGGSTAMFLRGTGILNRPSDGAERAVGNHLGIYASGSGPARFCPKAPDPVEPEAGADDPGEGGTEVETGTDQPSLAGSCSAAASTSSPALGGMLLFAALATLAWRRRRPASLPPSPGP